MPTLTDPVVIDGTTQPGLPLNAFGHRIELNGNSAGSGASGLTINAGNCTIKGLVINRFGTGITVQQNGGNVISGNYIGTNAAGDASVPNSQGVSILVALEHAAGQRDLREQIVWCIYCHE